VGVSCASSNAQATAPFWSSRYLRWRLWPLDRKSALHLQCFPPHIIPLLCGIFSAARANAACFPAP
jgi:hypothetical protein